MSSDKDQVKQQQQNRCLLQLELFRLEIPRTLFFLRNNAIILNVPNGLHMHRVWFTQHKCLVSVLYLYLILA